ncbi:MAG: hypothetical protein ACO29O_07750, partial [Chitinophagaceae bacterium]
MNVWNFILFILWIITACYFYIRWYKRNTSNWNASILIYGFVIKIILGCIYGFVFYHFYGGDDSCLYHQQSIKETANLLHDPLDFVKSVFLNGSLERYEMGSIWKEIEYTFFIKILAIFNLFSGGNYYLNVILYGTIIFPAPILFISFFSNINPTRKHFFYLIFFFFIPFVFWTSGIRKEGFISVFLAIVLFQFSNWLNNKKSMNLTLTFFSLSLLFIFRYEITLTIIPLLLIWWILDRTKIKWNPWVATSTFTLLGCIAFFLSKWIGPINLPGLVADHQNAFMKLKGGSYLFMEPMNDSLTSFLKNFPYALDHTFLRPYLFSEGSLLIQFSKIESWLVVVIGIIFIFSKPRIHHQKFAIPLLFFILMNYLFLGYTVPFVGAILRYRVIYETFLIA